MSNPLVVREPDAMRPIHAELLSGGAPLCADLVRELAFMEHGLFEFLTDTPVPGNAGLQTPGHRHGRKPGDGVYLPRHGVIHPGFIAEQATSETAYVTVRFTHLRDDGPDAGGEEQAGEALSTARAALFLHPDYTRLLFPVLLKAEAGTTAIARLSLVQGATLRVSDTRQTSAFQWTPCWFDLPIANSPEYGGWHHLVLELRGSTPDKTVFIASADACFKPMPGSLGNGAAYLIGETP